MPRYAEAGSTLIMVTWLLLLITIVAGFLLYRAELEWAVTLNLERTRQTRELARAILTEQLALLTADDNDYDASQETWFHQTGFWSSERNGYQVTVTVEDEGSKPNLNLLTEKGLTQLLGDELSPDPILDWIDPNGELRDEGAEAPYYQGLKPAYKPRDGFMATPRELLQLKNGARYYEKLAPEVTVYGRYNPNTLTPDQFGGLLLALGFDHSWVEGVQEKFETNRLESRFASPDDLVAKLLITPTTRKQLQPMLQFGGGCNLNFVSQTGLTAFLSEAGQKTEWAAQTVRRRKEQPFTTVAEIQSFFRTKNPKFKTEDYFTVTSIIWRYRVWLVKKSHTFYLETVQQRVPGGLKQKWRVKTLAWLELQDDAAPPVATAVSAEKQEGEDREDGSQSSSN
jgi:type II secretory pathway component PulK